MALSTIRKMTDEDVERMEAAAQRFIDRHWEDFRRLYCTALPEDGAGSVDWIESHLADGYGDGDVQISTRRYLRKLWLAAFRRAVREPSADGCGWGHIGYHVD